MGREVTQKSFNFSDELNRYTRKCRQHLRRALVFRAVILTNPPDFQRWSSLPFELDDLFDQDGTIEERFHRSVNDAHFLLLKVNFEFYLSRALRGVWDACHREIVGKSFQQRNKLPDGVRISNKMLLNMACNADWSGILAGDEVIPSHGLDELANCFREFLGVSLQELVQQGKQGNARIDDDVDPWSQIHCAFEVRHLIEHSKGKVDGRFVRNCHGHLGKTTWRDVAVLQDAESRVTTPQRIRIRDQDIEQTFWAMDVSLDGIRDALLSRVSPRSAH